MRFHVLALPHVHTTYEFSSCAYTIKVINFCRMMHEIGHEVFLYSGEKNETLCKEHICCISEEQRIIYLDGINNSSKSINANWDLNNQGWITYNNNAIKNIRERIQDKDFICAIAGNCHKPIADAFPAHLPVEFGIGYTGTFSKYKVWESYAWMHLNYGAQSNNNAYGVDGNFYDTVIPGYLPMELFPFQEQKEDYFLFIGRLIGRKGFDIASQVCKHLGKKLYIAGQGTPSDYGEYLGVIDAKQRGRLMAGATAVFVPTLYIEPFGNVAIEAQACGTPVISTDWGAMTETVEHGKTGFRCSTFKEFVKACEDVKTLDPYYIRERIARNYSLPVTARKYERYFERLMDLWKDGWYQL